MSPPLKTRIEWLLDYEPTWFPEFGSGLAILLWSCGCFLTDDLTIQGRAWLMPIIGFGFGPTRWMLLLRLRYAPRVLSAFFSAAWWSWIICGLALKFGIVPMLGVVIGVLVMDLLTLARFSLPCFRDLLAELRARHVAG